MKIKRVIIATTLITIGCLILFSTILSTKNKGFLTVKEGDNMAAIAANLKQSNIIGSEKIFLLYSKVWMRLNKNKTYKIGRYKISNNTSFNTLLNNLIEGSSLHYSVTIPEGVTAYQATEILNQTEGLTGDVISLPEGSILPDTYFFDYGTSKQELIKHMQKSMTNFLEKNWPLRDMSISLKNPQEALILASIVEREARLENERPHVASVFYNRLRSKMRLQACSALLYILNQGGKISKKSLLLTDLSLNNPYNVYRKAGLPPGPISMPGKAAIIATLHPLHTNDLYFVIDGKGGHVFSSTFEDHKKSKSKVRKNLNTLLISSE